MTTRLPAAPTTGPLEYYAARFVDLFGPYSARPCAVTSKGSCRQPSEYTSTCPGVSQITVCRTSMQLATQGLQYGIPRVL